MEDLKKKISEILKNLTSQKNIKLYKRFLKFLNPYYILKVWKDNSISVINKIKTSIPILLLIWILIPGGSGETLYILQENVAKNNDGIITHNGDEFTGGAVKVYEKLQSVRYIEFFEDGEYTGITKYNTISSSRLDSKIQVEGKYYYINSTPNSILDSEYYTKYYRGKYIEYKVPVYWKDNDAVRHGVGQKFDSEGNVIEEQTFVDGELKKD